MIDNNLAIKLFSLHKTRTNSETKEIKKESDIHLFNFNKRYKLERFNIFLQYSRNIIYIIYSMKDKINTLITMYQKSYSKNHAIRTI